MQVHSQALAPPGKCLHLPGTVTEPPRKAAGRTKGNRAYKGSPGAQPPLETGLLSPHHHCQSSVVDPVTGREHIFLLFVSPVPDLMSTNLLNNRRRLSHRDSLRPLESCGHSQIQRSPKKTGCIALWNCSFFVVPPAPSLWLLTIVGAFHGGGGDGGRCGECTKGGIISLKDSN